MVFKKLSIITMVLTVVFLIGMLFIAFKDTAQTSAQTYATIPNFVGREACAECHETEYEQHIRHGHNFQLNEVIGEQQPQYPYNQMIDPPEGYSWNEISFVIGGYAWKARFIDDNGFIITGDANTSTQYNFPLIDERTGQLIAEGGWSPYYSGKIKPYTCGPCHTTGYNHNQGTTMYNMPGLIGQWVEEGVQCEECHGPGSLHILEPIRVEMNITETCANCHYRDAESVIESSDGFIQHHEQYEELLMTPHTALDCINCHNPHQSAVYADEKINPNQGLKVTCVSCHFEQTMHPDHVQNDVYCTDCHMAPMAANGNRNDDLHWGDMSAHLYQINIHIAAPQFNDDGTSVMPYITLEYACRRCHFDWTIEDMAEIAKNYHPTP